MANNPKVSKAFGLTVTISFQICSVFQILANKAESVITQAQGMTSHANVLLVMADAYAN